MPVSASEWFADSVTRIRADGARGLANSLYDVYLAAWLTATRYVSPGTNIFSREWDALVVLDACRVDVMREVADEFAFIPGVDAIWSVGTSSFEWMTKTFTSRHRRAISRTAYVCANPYINRSYLTSRLPPLHRTVPFGPRGYGTLPPDAFAYVDEITAYGVDSELGVVPPRTVTDRAVAVGRQRDADRLLVHYMQPHEPYIDPERGLGSEVFRRLREGELQRDEAWASYRANLRLVLEEVELLLDNLDADRVVITADHGEAFGELSFWGHMPGFPHPALMRVPWIETSATDAGDYTPTVQPTDREPTDEDLDAQLRHLGYR